MITVVVVVLLMRGRFGLGCRRRRRLRSLIALRRRRIKYHAVELYRLLGVSLEWRDDHTKGKGQDRKTHHRISSDFLPSDFRHSALAQQPSISERKARIVSVKLGLNLSNGGDRPQRVVVTIRDPRRYIFQWRLRSTSAPSSKSRRDHPLCHPQYSCPYWKPHSASEQSRIA